MFWRIRDSRLDIAPFMKPHHLTFAGFPTLQFAFTNESNLAHVQPSGYIASQTESDFAKPADSVIRSHEVIAICDLC